MSSNIFADLLVNDFPGSRDSEDADDLASLPFPQPISRAVFSSPDFNTESFLVSHSQFRTLDDLRLELRQWVDKLENEMESLIEEDWQGYFTLGRGLAGGEVTVDNVERRVKQFERDVQIVKQRITTRIGEVNEALEEKKRIRRDADLVRRLLLVHLALQSLERGLFLQPSGIETVDDAESLYSTARLQELVSQYRDLTYLLKSGPPEHPFIRAHEERIERVKSTLEKDLRDGLTAAKKEGNTTALLDILRLCRTVEISPK